MQKAKILIVEDEAVIALGIEEGLQRLGFEVVGNVLSGEQAMEKLTEVTPDLILMDFRLSGEMDGADAAAQIRQRNDIPVIFLTAYSDEATLGRIRQAEPYGYLLKPFHERDLRNNIEVALYRHAADRSLRRRETYYRTLFENAHDAILVYLAEESLVLDVNPQACELYGYPAETLIGMSLERISKNPGRERAIAQAATQRSQERFTYITHHQRIDGSRIILEVNASTMDYKHRTAVIAIHRDITRRVQQQAELETYRHQLEELVEERTQELTRANDQLSLQIAALAATANGIMITNPQGIVTWVNPAFTRLTGFDAEDILGQTPRLLKSGVQGAAFYRKLWETIQNGEVWHGELVNRRKDGSLFFEEMTITPVMDAAGELRHFVAVFQDASEKRRASDALQRQAALGEVELAINRPQELEGVLDQVVEIATQTLSASAGAGIALLDPEIEAFISGRTNLPSRSGTKTFQYFRTQFGGTQWIVEHKAPLVVPDITQSAFDGGADLQALGVKAYVGTPLVVNDRALGVLYILDRQPRPYTQEEIEFLAALANRAALAITKVHLVRSLQQAKEAAEDAARTKAEFLANISHEFRTPLTSIITISELLQENSLDKSQAELTRTIESSAHRLLDLINEILDFSRLEASKLSLKNQPFELRQVIEDSMGLIVPGAAQKDIDLAYWIAEDVPQTVLGDPTRLSQVLTNLLSNALKFTETGHVFIDISLRSLQPETGMAELLFSVEDTGIGIHPANIPQLFHSFSQIDGSTTRKYGGTGLGLAICKQLVGLMGGEIWTHSSGVPGEGSAFQFTVQMQAVSGRRPLHLGPDPAMLHGKHILVVCSPGITRMVLERQLASWGAHVHAFSQPIPAMTWLEEGRALDAAILDSVSATQQDQQLALARMIGKFRQDDFPLVFLLRLPDQRNPASSLAVAEILYKPVSPARLYEALAAAIHRPESSPAHPASARPLTRQPGQPLRILLAEDDPANRSVIRLRLERLGYQAALAANGLQVVQMLETGAYDIIIMDLQMPEMDGLATTRYIREALPADCQPFIIALTADTRWETQTLLLGSGFNLFLQKPVQKEALAQALEQAAPRPPERAGQATGQAPEDVHIDEDVLNDLCQTVGSESPQAVEQILGLFFEHAPRLIENIEAAAAQQKPDRLRAELHALKGHCELYGAARLVRLCKSLESAIAAGEAVNLTHGVAEIQAEYSVVLANLTSRQARTRVK